MGVYMCPVCNGRGFVRTDFYTYGTNVGKSTGNSIEPETCRSCKGKGIVFDSEVFDTNVYCDDLAQSTFELKGTCSNCNNVCKCFNQETGELLYKCSLDHTYYNSDHRCKNWSSLGTI